MSAKEGVRPILALYRGILRAHYRRLPTPMRVLGDSYAREEFRRHLEGKTTHDQWIEFGSEWSKINQRGKNFGRPKRPGTRPGGKKRRPKGNWMRL